MKQLEINNENVKNAVINIIHDILELNEENITIHIPLNDEGELILDEAFTEPSYCGYEYDNCIKVNISEISEFGYELDDNEINEIIPYIVDAINEAIDEYNELNK